MNDIADGILGIVDLRKSLKEMHPPLQFVISIYDPAMTLRNSAMVRQEVVARIIAVIKEVQYNVLRLFLLTLLSSRIECVLMIERL